MRGTFPPYTGNKPSDAIRAKQWMRRMGSGLFSLSHVLTEQQQIEAVIGGLESQRALMGDALVDAALAPLRARLLALSRAQPNDAAQTLKQVTVLFLDVVGSTTLS